MNIYSTEELKYLSDQNEKRFQMIFIKDGNNKMFL